MVFVSSAVKYLSSLFDAVDVVSDVEMLRWDGSLHKVALIVYCHEWNKCEQTLIYLFLSSRALFNEQYAVVGWLPATLPTQVKKLLISSPMRIYGAFEMEQLYSYKDRAPTETENEREHMRLEDCKVSTHTADSKINSSKTNQHFYQNHSVALCLLVDAKHLIEQLFARDLSLKKSVCFGGETM
jgi:hypothetical protein